MAVIHVDNKPYEVPEGQNLLHALLSLGFNVPYFCWHPAMGSVGACRQCAVKQFKDESDSRGRIVMSCMVPVSDGMRVSVDDAEAKAFRAQVIEWLMLNHPHDCPVCDEGGECHLQDMTVMTGHRVRKTRFPKRTFENQDLGPLIAHEMNRCIECYRCVRFYRDQAGGRDLNVFGSKNHVYFGRSSDGVLESKFSGNLVEVCPTGVFTDKTLARHFTRKWDIQSAPSVCVHCGLGCNTLPGERYGKLRRIANRFHSRVNGYFLCDRGRYGYEFVNDPRRIRQPLLRREGRADSVPPEVAVEYLGHHLARAKAIGIGSPRASLEANYALERLVGPERFHAGFAPGEARLLRLILDVLRDGPARTPSLAEVEACDAVLILGDDPCQTAPRVELALRQSVRQEPMKIADRLEIPRWNDAMVREALQEARGPLYVATPAPTDLDAIARRTYRGTPGRIAALGFAVASAVTGASSEAGGLAPEDAELAREIAAALRGAARPLVISGTGPGSEAAIRAAANVATALHREGSEASILFTVPEANSLGLAMLGGRGIDEAAARFADGSADTLIVLENDLYRRSTADRAYALLSAARHVIVLDHLDTVTTRQAEAVLPAATFAEGDGTLVSSEGRAQRHFQVFVPEGDIRESWRWIRDIGVIAGRSEMGSWRTLDDVLAALAGHHPELARIREAAPGAGFRVVGQKVPRESPRYTGRTAMNANRSVHEPKPPADPDSPLSFTMEGYQGIPPAPLVTRFWAPGWNSVQSIHKFQSEVGGALRGGEGGVRLIEPSETSRLELYPAASDPGVEAPREPDEVQVVPVHAVFGSEELSVRAPAIAQLAPRAAIALAPETAERLGLEDGDEVEVAMRGASVTLPVRKAPGMAPGVAGFPAGFPGVPTVELPCAGRVRKVSA